MSEQLPSLSSDENNVRITIPKKRMKDFIGDVLKTKRQIAKDFQAVFHLKKEDVVNIISVIDHRIMEQNSAELSEISIFVLYDDGSSREYTSINQFEAVDDNLKAVSTTVLISLAYLIKFSNDDFPSKNDIKILIKSSQSSFSRPSETGNIIITVETNKFTWAEDIINNFSSYIGGRFKKHSKLNKLVQSSINLARTSFITYVLMMTFTMWLFFSYLDDLSAYNSKILDSVIPNLMGSDVPAANAKLDFLIKSRRLVSGLSFWNMDVGFKYLLYILSAVLVFAVLPSNFVRSTDRSYISIGKVSEEKNLAKIRKKSQIMNTIFFGCGLSIICSILSSYLYDYIKLIFT